MKKFLLELLFPDGVECVLCDRLIDHQHPFLCRECLSQFDFISGKSCDGCGKILPPMYDGAFCSECMAHDQPYKRMIACVTYNDFAAEAVWKFKYHHKRYIGRMMGLCMADLLKATYIEDVDILVPVPIHNSKETVKGYNHSAIVAKEMAKICDKSCFEDLLVRTRATRPLKDLTRQERFKELETTFRVKEGYEVLAPAGKRILLIDDIFTTGTTARACSEALVEAGFTDITVMTFATGLL
ncbi:MAG: ComF family protein [Clostridia bacterium]|nr:ComF family protein [Clostridia bacterium]